MMNNLIFAILLASCIAFLNGEDDYNFVETPMTMSEASKNCQQWGGELVTIQNAAQNAFIFNEMRKRKFSKVWIGLNDIKKEGQFEWVDPYTSSKYINWSPNEPNNSGNEDCTEIMISRGGKWNDQSCTDKVPSVCYKAAFASQYTFVENAMTMNDAAENCRKIGGELVTIQNAAQNAFIFNEMRKRKFSKVWIGLNDIKKEGQFEWVDPYTCSKYINWSPNEPNNSGNEDCTEIIVSRGGKWNDQSCTDKVPSVCYKAAIVPSQFKFVKTAMSKSDAVANCRKLGGELATIQNSAQNTFIFNELKKRGMSKAWFGFNDIKGEGKFEWVDPNTCSKYTNWRKNEPNNLGNEDCTEMILAWSGKWNDQSCTDKRSSVCYKTTGFGEQQDAYDVPEPEDFEDDVSEPEIFEDDDILSME